MNRFTVEETNLLSIYHEGSKAQLTENINAALPYMDADMRELAKRALSKVDALTEEEFAELSIKRLSPPQSRKVNSLVRRECCNCDNGHCILLDDGDECVCPQLISYSLLCKWFRIAVLPLDKLLYAELFKTEDKKRCTVCGTFFVSKSNSVKYCPDCRKRITNRQAAERMRKRRALVTR